MKKYSNTILMFFALILIVSVDYYLKTKQTLLLVVTLIGILGFFYFAWISSKKEKDYRYHVPKWSFSSSLTYAFLSVIGYFYIDGLNLDPMIKLLLIALLIIILLFLTLKYDQQINEELSKH